MKIKYVDCMDDDESEFGVLDESQRYLVNSRLARQLKPLGVLSAETLYSFAKSDPQFTQEIFGLTKEQYQSALDSLESKLDRHAPDFLEIEKQEPVDYATGVPLPDHFPIPGESEEQD